MIQILSSFLVSTMIIFTLIAELGCTKRNYKIEDKNTDPKPKTIPDPNEREEEDEKDEPITNDDKTVPDDNSDDGDRDPPPRAPNATELWLDSENTAARKAAAAEGEDKVLFEKIANKL